MLTAKIMDNGITALKW